MIYSIGDICLILNTDYYSFIIKTIIGQQISGRAASSIWEKLTNKIKKIEPQVILNTKDEDLKNVGVSFRKIEYIKNLSELIKSKKFSFELINNLENEEIINLLSSIKGVGIWTSQMFLIFCLGKKDVMPINDSGIKKAMACLYHTEKPINNDTIALISNLWSPYRTIACLYLWEGIDRGIL